ncbi:hypothetical protein SAMN03159341_103260 [Paenibacillus sp. 1_12]|uniref:DUF3329 domain-containing protein n=1 Tax=Paenibacillus sp. 1_12 TaxID=1566278 RepID=UPI0008F0AFE4|nr:DUF6056 family protein [Paenibacillus sp. 1_12]SFL10955.1 hypothetical protein SAMN03159341_103260 [Paenibacillus sp. 1_12]
MILTKYNNVLILALLFVYMFTINHFIPMFADDFNYSFMWDKSKRVEDFIDIYRSQWMHYFEWGGRTVSHTIGQILLMSNKAIISFCNALMYVLFICLLYWHSQGKRVSLQSNAFILLLLSFICWMCLPSFGETTIWLIGSVNYLWTSVIILIFLLPFRIRMLVDQGMKDHLLSRVSMFLIGVIAGWTNENTALSVIVLTFLFLIYFYTKRSISAWMLTGFVGTLIGFILLVLAPGNMVRAAKLQSVEDYSFMLYHIKMPLMTTINIVLYQAPLWIIMLIMAIVLLNHFIKNRLTYKDIKEKYGVEILFSLIVVALSLFNNLVMFASPYFPLRAGFGSTVFLIIGVFSIFRMDMIKAWFSYKTTFSKIIISIVSIVLFISMGLVYEKYSKLNEENNLRLVVVNENKIAGHDAVVVAPYSIQAQDTYQTYFGHVFVSDIGGDPSIWPNNIYAQYLGLKSIRIDKPF